MSNNIFIREAKTADLPQMLEIYNDIILHTTAVYDYEPHTIEMREKWFADRQNQKLPVLVTVDGEEITGFGSFGPFRAWAAYKYSVEHSVYVKSDRRGQGIAKIILPALISEAQKRKMHTLIAGIDATNEASIRLHQHFGFIEVAHFREVGYKFDRWLDLIFFQLMLDGDISK